MPKSPAPGSLRAAFAPYLVELSGCCCPICRAVVYAGAFPRRTLTAAAYWAAISDQLREVAEGRHRRVELAEWQATLPRLGRYRHERSVLTGGVGLGVGVGIGGDHYRALVEQEVAKRRADPVVVAVPAIEAEEVVEEPGQVALFDVA